MAATPNYVGSYGRPWLISLNTDSSTDEIFGISPANISIIMRNIGLLQDSTSTGVITIVSASPAQITWQLTAPDFANAGNFSIIPVVTFATGPVVYDPISLAINAR